MDIHHPLGFDWGEWVAIFTLIGVAATYAHSNMSRMAAESSQAESQKLSKAIDQLEKTMIEVNATLRSIREDRAEDRKRLDLLTQEVGKHRDWLISDHRRLKELEENAQDGK
ncbi:hypothetical protein [Limosilactobacillus oris]|uniref:hypothetical protein n=1 Tax=Limosilactobacillus oris TaxID=1632 RepID=UPI0024307785|nr:hypothetical protein [Limosilactobacillus oris]MBS5330561.1 hypothetical protein [Limosilactobacillus oris]